MSPLFNIWHSIQNTLFPWLGKELDPLTEKQQEFVRVIELAEVQKHMSPYRWQGIGRKRDDRLAIVKAFVAKAVYNFPTTKILIAYLYDSKNLRRLCGWESKGEIPSESTFSRAFEEFSRGRLGEKIHEAMVKQLGRGLAENVADLPTRCDVGTKLNAKGYKTSWTGYKLHIDSIDGDIPVSALLSSASLHDSQAAIPLAQMTAERIISLYDLMDSAYDAPQIRSYSAELGHVPIIDTNPRRGEKKEMDPAQAVRFRNRTTAERVNSNLKDNYGGRFVRVRRAAQVG